MIAEDILTKIKDIVRAQAPDFAGELLPSSSFEEMGLDSLNRIDLLAAAEAAFGIEVPDDQVAGLLRVQDLADFVASAQVG
jgi:acyl carrier protein